jgi:hypothetical protein
MSLSITSRPTNFNCVHLPILYELSTTNFPTNSVDTSRTCTFTNDNGYCRLALSGDIKATGSANELEYVKVVYSGGTEIFQIITWYSDTDITIDLEYDAGLTFTSVQYYYANYHGVFKVYAGLRPGHTYDSQKPYRLLTTVKAVPDSQNKIRLNVSEIIKSDIDILIDLKDGIENDLNNSSQFTEFYIEYAESYDYSPDGYTLQTYTSSYTSDSSDYAIATNSKVPFRNEYSDMRLYAGLAAEPLKFMTLFTNPVLFEGFPFKIYFLQPYNETYTLNFDQYNESGLVQSDQFIANEDEGLYMNEDLEQYLSLSATYAQIYLSDNVSEILTVSIDRACYNNSIYLMWRNYLGGMDHWLFTAEKDYSIEIESVKQSEDDIFIGWDVSYAGSRIKYDTQRVARESILVRSQNLTLDQVQAIQYIKTSPLVLWNDVSYLELGKNVLVDSSSFLVYSESDKLYSISFNIQMTDTIPSQSL